MWDLPRVPAQRVWPVWRLTAASAPSDGQLEATRSHDGLRPGPWGQGPDKHRPRDAGPGQEPAAASLAASGEEHWRGHQGAGQWGEGGGGWGRGRGEIHCRAHLLHGAVPHLLHRTNISHWEASFNPIFPADQTSNVIRFKIVDILRDFHGTFQQIFKIWTIFRPGKGFLQLGLIAGQPRKCLWMLLMKKLNVERSFRIKFHCNQIIPGCWISPPSSSDLLALAQNYEWKTSHFLKYDQTCLDWIYYQPLIIIKRTPMRNFT